MEGDIVNKISNEERFLLMVIRRNFDKKAIIDVNNGVDIEKAYTLALKHHVECMFFEGIKDLKIYIKPAMYQRMQYNAQIAIAKDANQQKGLDDLKKELTKAKVSFIPLKGFMQKDLYPCTYMRQMSDIDILIKSEDAAKVRNIMTNLGYDTMHFGTSHHDIYHKKPFLNVEIHNKLFADTQKRWNDYFDKYYRRMLYIDDGVYEKNPDEAVQYAFIIAHLAKHYKGRGTGIRSITDIYSIILNKRYLIESKDFIEHLKKLDVYDFFIALSRLSQKWFLDGCFDDDDVDGYILKSGIYGRQEQYIVNNIANKAFLGRTRYIYRLCFPKKEVIYRKYPKLRKRRYLLFLAYIYRGIEIAVSRPYRFMEFKKVFSLSNAQISSSLNIQKKAGINEKR